MLGSVKADEGVVKKLGVDEIPNVFHRSNAYFDAL